MNPKNYESIWAKENKSVFKYLFILISVGALTEIYTEYISAGFSPMFFHRFVTFVCIVLFFLLYYLKVLTATVTYTIVHYTIIFSFITSVYYLQSKPDFNFESFFLKTELTSMLLTIGIAFIVKPIHILYSIVINFIFVVGSYFLMDGNFPISILAFYFLIVTGSGVGCFYIQKNFFRLRKQVKETNKRLTEINTDLNKSNTSKDQMFKIIGHDLRTPFGQMSELLDLYENSEELIPKPELIQMMREATNNGNELLQGLMNWVKSENYEIKLTEEKHSLNSIINNVISFFTSTSLQKKVSLINSSQLDIETNFDALFIETVLRNLVSNAIKYSHRNSIVFIKAEIVNEELNISVIDKGIGMDADTLNNLFESNLNISSKGTNEEVGTGFGLTICRKLIKKHNGFLIITSEKNKGTTMTINLPYKKRAE